VTEILDAYKSRYDSTLIGAALALEKHLQDLFAGAVRVDRISARAKSPDSFVKKALSKDDAGKAKYDQPLDQIQDQIGARIIVFYLDDVERVNYEIQKYLRPIEIKSHVPENEWKFGYFGSHFVLICPDDIWKNGQRPPDSPAFFELQIKTLFQHAWSEANHDLGYKGIPIPGLDAERKMALASAQAWGSDQIFSELWNRIERTSTHA
jgi:putative GTP pyrophosphokinase